MAHQRIAEMRALADLFISGACTPQAVLQRLTSMSDVPEEQHDAIEKFLDRLRGLKRCDLAETLRCCCTETESSVMRQLCQNGELRPLIDYIRSHPEGKRAYLATLAGRELIYANRADWVRAIITSIAGEDPAEWSAATVCTVAWALDIQHQHHEALSVLYRLPHCVWDDRCFQWEERLGRTIRRSAVSRANGREHRCATPENRD